MTTILKYRLEAVSDQDLAIPCGSLGIDILHADWQKKGGFASAALHLWALVQPDAPSLKVRVHVRTTGAPMGEAELGARHVGTVLVGGGAIVFHVLIQSDHRIRIRGQQT